MISMRAGAYSLCAGRWSILTFFRSFYELIGIMLVAHASCRSHSFGTLHGPMESAELSTVTALHTGIPVQVSHKVCFKSRCTVSRATTEGKWPTLVVCSTLAHPQAPGELALSLWSAPSTGLNHVTWNHVAHVYLAPVPPPAPQAPTNWSQAPMPCWECLIWPTHRLRLLQPCTLQLVHYLSTSSHVGPSAPDEADIELMHAGMAATSAI